MVSFSRWISDVLNCGSRFAATRNTTSSQRFQIAHDSNRKAKNPEGPAIEKIQSRLKISIPARNFQSRSKISISIEKFNPRVSIYGALVVYKEGLDRKFQSTIDRSKFSIPKAAIEFFQSSGPLGTVRIAVKALLFFIGPQMGCQIRRGWIWRFWGALIFRPEVPKPFKNRYLGISGLKIGAPQKRQILPRRIWPPICGPLNFFTF